MSSSKLRLVSIIAAVLGLLDSLYLSWIKFSNKTSICAGIGECEIVNTSRYSEIGGIPIAVLGAGAYLFIIFLLVLETRSKDWAENSPLYVFGASLVGVLYSAFLTYVEIAILHAICPFCVISAILILIIFIISILRLRQVLA